MQDRHLNKNKMQSLQYNKGKDSEELVTHDVVKER